MHYLASKCSEIIVKYDMLIPIYCYRNILLQVAHYEKSFIVKF